MSIYKLKVNPATGDLNLVVDQALLKVKESVSTYNDLPITGNSENDVRITQDTDKMYTWSISASSGNLSDWIEVGSATSVDWSAIINKPTSSVEDIDDAVSKKHSQNTDTKLDEGGSNEVSASQLKNLVNNALTSSDIDDFTIKYENNQLKIADRIEHNIMLLAFYRAVDHSKTFYNLDDSVMDEFEDESGIDTAHSVNQIYNTADDYYTNYQAGHTYTAHGNLQLKTSVKKFGSASCYSDGDASSYITTPASSDFDFGTGDFVIDFFWYPQDLSVKRGFFVGGSGDDLITAWYSPSSTGLIVFNVRESGSWTFGASPVQVVSTNVWHHIAFVRSGDNFYIYYDGNRISNTSCAGKTMDGSSDIFSVARASEPDKSAFYVNKGYLDEFRVSKGTDRGWTGSTITVPTSEHTADNYTKTLLHMNGTDGSTDIQDATGSTSNMTLISEEHSSGSGTNPDQVRLVVFEEDVDSVIINTDIKAYVTREGSDPTSATWVQVILQDDGKFQGDKRILTGIADLDITGMSSGTDLAFKITTHNTKELKIHAVSMNWD